MIVFQGRTEEKPGIFRILEIGVEGPCPLPNGDGTYTSARPIRMRYEDKHGNAILMGTDGRPLDHPLVKGTGVIRSVGVGWVVDGPNYRELRDGEDPDTATVTLMCPSTGALTPLVPIAND